MLCYRAGDVTGGLIWKSQGRGEGLQLAYLLPWLERSVGSQIVLVRGGVLEKDMRVRRMVRSRRSVGSRGESGMVGRVFCCRTEHKTRVLVLEEQKER